MLDFGRKFTLNFGEDLFFFFFGDHLILGGKIGLNFGFRPKIHSEFWRRPFFFFFGDHLILAGKNCIVTVCHELF